MIEPLIPIPKGRKGPVLKNWQNLTPEQLAAELAKHNGCNLGVRLDRYAVLDPDSQEATELLNTWEKEGKLPPTIAWRTAAGNIKRLYLRPPDLEGPISISHLNLQLRTGTGMQDVIPPSYVEDPEKGIKGYYYWLPDQDPKSLDPVPLPDEVLTFFKSHVKRRKSGEYYNTRFNSTSNIKFDLSQGHRDETLFHIATCLRRGGMAKEHAEKIIVMLAKMCSPPFPENEALRKIESAWKQARGEINITAMVREWVLSTNGDFLSTDVDRELQLSTMSTSPEEKRIILRTLSKALERLVKEGIIERVGSRRGHFRRLERESELLDFVNVDCTTVFPLKWPAPFHLERLINLYHKNLIVVAGASNAGKTALLLNLVRENMDKHRIVYFSSEMGPEELRLRLEKFGLPITSWRFEARERSTNFADVIIPDAVNIIDYFELTDNFYQIGGEFKKIFERLTTGIAIIALQKKAGEDLGRGGAFSLEKARLYLSLDSGTLKVVKAKNWARPGENPNGMVFRFKLVDGCKFLGT